MGTHWLKRFQAVAAALGWWALALQFYLAMKLYLVQGTGIVGGLITYFSYFTILTNILVALALTAPLLSGRSLIAAFFSRPTINTGIAASIAVVGIAYTLLLQDLWDPKGLQRVADELLHHVMPVLFIVYWWFAIPGDAVRWSDVWRWTLYPAVYFIYVMTLGALSGVYPYPFIDAQALGYGRAVANAGGIMASFVAIAFLLVALARFKGKRPA